MFENFTKYNGMMNFDPTWYPILNTSSSSTSDVDLGQLIRDLKVATHIYTNRAGFDVLIVDKYTYNSLTKHTKEASVNQRPKFGLADDRFIGMRVECYTTLSEIVERATDLIRSGKRVAICTEGLPNNDTGSDDG